MSDPPIGGSFDSGHLYPETLPQGSRVERAIDNPFAGISHDVGQLQQAGRRRLQPSDALHRSEAAIEPSRQCNFGIESGMLVLVVEIEDQIDIADGFTMQNVQLEAFKADFDGLDDCLGLQHRGLAATGRDLLVERRHGARRGGGPETR